MNDPRQVTAVQTAIIISSSIIGVGVLPLPLIAAVHGGTGAPLVTVIGILISMVSILILSKLGQRFPSKTIIQYSEDVIGKIPAILGSICIIAFFALLTALAAREFGEVVVTSVLKKTPLEITVVVMLLLAAVSTRNNMTTFAYIHQFYFPVVVIPAVLIIIFSLKNGNVLFLQPFWGGDHSVLDMLNGGINIASLFQTSFVITMVIPAMRSVKRVMKSAFWGVLIAGGMYVCIVIATIVVFGPKETSKLLWPTLELFKTTSLPANVLERLDAAFLAIWVTAVYTTLFCSYYFTIHSLSQLFKLKDHRMFSIMLIPFVFVLAMLPHNVVHMYDVIIFAGRVGLYITLGYPLLLLLIAMLRKKREDTDVQTSQADSRKQR